MNQTKYDNYQALVYIDTVLNNYTPKYPFNLHQQAKYTQHQITLYQSNYCHSETQPVSEQPSIEGGAHGVEVVFV